MIMYKPKEIRVQPCVYHRVHLTDSLRYTGSIYALLNQLHTRIMGKYARIYFYPGFGPGTRIIGEKPQFVTVKDYRAMEFKVHELLQKFKKEVIQRSKIAFIKTESWKDLVRIVLRMDTDMNIKRNEYEDMKRKYMDMKTDMNR